MLIALKGAAWLQAVDMGIIPLVVLFVILSGFINMFMGSASAKWAIMERWRKKYKKYPRYWMVTELGGTRYEHVHIHGIMTLNEDQEKELTEIWAYGFVYIGYACNNETIGYITK